MDTGEFVNISEIETTTAIIAKNITNSVTSNKFVDPLFNKYAIIGALLLFTCLLLASVLYYYTKTYNSCCRDEHASHLYSMAKDDASSLMDDEEASSELFTSCHLYVDDHEVNTASGFEYDCRSIDMSSTEEERTLLINQNQRRYEAFHCPDPCVIHTLS
ncbi:hypothetical protein HNY73_000301 [Argiope bruennichi]|uniref:Uncharacterized protein n=1 Tax=Argiope bruennichi TaxID=94029 RepID=A0A8T0G1Y7_ARGBR|nr:hypothetical protein HNY73_000301 [Argiope bruennichi]